MTKDRPAMVEGVELSVVPSSFHVYVVESLRESLYVIVGMTDFASRSEDSFIACFSFPRRGRALGQTAVLTAPSSFQGAVRALPRPL